MASSENYAVLFSGGGDLNNNNSRYYNSTKSTYEALIERGVKAENITILYAYGVDPGKDTQFSADYDTKVQLDHLFDGISLEQLSSVGDISDKQWDSLYAQYNVNDSRTQVLLRDVMEDGINFSIDPRYRQALQDPGIANIIEGDLNGKIAALNLVENGSSLFITSKLGRDQENENEVIIDMNFYRKSDFSFVEKGTIILPAITSALKGKVNSLATEITNNDSLFVWTFDHGGTSGNPVGVASMLPPYYKGINVADLSGWGVDIGSDEFTDIFKEVILKSRFSTFALAQCYSGGLLQAMLDNQDLANKDNWFGMAATNQYQPSWDSYFADAVAKALKEGASSGGELFDSIIDTDYETLATQDYSPNEYPQEYWDGLLQGKEDKLEHPWFYQFESVDNPLFVNNASRGLDTQGLELLGKKSLEDSLLTFSSSLSVREDQSLDLFGGLKSHFGDLSDLSFEGYAPSIFGTVDYEEKFDSLIYTPLSDRYGQDSVVLRFDDGGISFDVKVDIDVESVNDAPMAVDDFVQISSGERDVLIDVDDAPGFFDDTDVDGDELSITSYSAPVSGTIEKVGDFLFEYQPNAGFVGSDSFLYVLSDGEALDVAEVFINVVDSSI